MVAYGFHQSYQGWTGIISGSEFEKDYIYPSFNGKASEHKGDFYVQGGQLKGHSGALVLNSKGAIGMAHTTDIQVPLAVGVVPFENIQSCFLQHVQKLKFEVDCPLTTALDPPLFSLR